MRLEDKDEIVGVAVASNEDEEILVVTEKGFGKRSKVSEYRLQSRGGQGVKALNVTEKNGKLVALTNVTVENDLIML